MFPPIVRSITSLSTPLQILSHELSLCEAQPPLNILWLARCYPDGPLNIKKLVSQMRRIRTFDGVVGLSA